jgi:hypothetical protein
VKRVASFVLVFLLAYASPAQERKNACTQYDETHLDACVSGRQGVWAYDFSGPDTGGQVVQSGGFTSARSAQSDRDSAQRLCSVLDRYFNHTGCQTNYGSPYCAACAPGAPRQGSLPQESQVWLEKSNLVIGQWEQQSAQALRIFASENPQPNPYSNVGSVLSDYTTALRDAVTDLIHLRQAMQPIYAGIAGFGASIQPAIDALQNDENRVQTAQASYQQALSAPPAASYGAAGNWNNESVTVGGNLVSQAITVSGPDVSVTQRTGNAGSGKTDTWSVSSQALRTASVQLGRYGNYYALTFTLRQGTARHSQQFGAMSPITTNAQQVEMDFPSEADARAAAAALCPGATF